MTNWYVAGTGNHQGLVVEESTGRTVAVTYDKADAPLAAAAPAMLAALHALEGLLTDWPTMRALSATGAQRATANKAEARSLVAGAIAAATESAL